MVWFSKCKKKLVNFITIHWYVPQKLKNDLHKALNSTHTYPQNPKIIYIMPKCLHNVHFKKKIFYIKLEKSLFTYLKDPRILYVKPKSLHSHV